MSKATQLLMMINESQSNPVTNHLPQWLDSLLQDVAQEYGGITYSDITKFKPNSNQLKKLKNLYDEYQKSDDDQKFRKIASEVVSIMKTSNRPAINEDRGEPTEEDLIRYREAAKKMVDEIEKRMNGPHPNRQELEEVFYQNMIAMKRGDIGRVEKW